MHEVNTYFTTSASTKNYYLKKMFLLTSASYIVSFSTIPKFASLFGKMFDLQTNLLPTPLFFVEFIISTYLLVLEFNE